MKYKKEFENTNVYVDKIKNFIIANEDNKEILIKFIPQIFENDVDYSQSQAKPVSNNAKRKGRPRKSVKLAV
jgi:hypothetical protein